LSGNRTFEARIHSDVKANYLASPPLVVAYASRGRMDIDLLNEPLGEGTDSPVYLRDIWPTSAEIDQTIAGPVDGEMFRSTYGDVCTLVTIAGARWTHRQAELFAWDESSTYVRLPPYFEGMSREPGTVQDVEGARVLVMLGDSITTDHISPAGAIRPTRRRAST
jgi:aconitate hydratase